MRIFDSLTSKLLVPIGISRTPFMLRLTLLITSAFWVGTASFYQITRPHFGQGTITFAGGTASAIEYPLLIKKAPKARFTFKDSVVLSRWHPTVFAFYPQDVLWGIKVNGDRVQTPGLPLSRSHHEGRCIDLTSFLHPGANEIELDMEVYWGEASLNIYASPWDKCSLFLLILVMATAVSTGAFFCCFFRFQISGAEISVLLVACLLRFIYVFGTPYFVRSYDWWGHAAYLDFVSQNLSLPDPHANWEAFQPPLYYFLIGGITKLLLFCGMAEEQRYFLWQGVSVVFSTGVLLGGLWLGRLLYRKEPAHRLYLLAVLAAAPALVFNASRISNDVLLNLLDFIWLGLLIAFWQRHDKRTWLALTLVLGCALLAKASAIVLIPISICCLVLIPDLSPNSKIVGGITLVMVVLGISGWYYVPRAFHENKVDSYVVGNIRDLNPKSHIDHIFLKSLVFNPFKVLRYPFVEPWGPRHEYFPEFFFKSIFVGEWYLGFSYRWVARGFILGALLLVPIFFRGIWCSLKRRTENDYPMLISLFAVFLAQWIFVQIAPFLSSQDFRYSVILLIPMLYFFIQGVADLSPQVKEAWWIILQLQILSCAIYLVEISFEG